VVCKVVCMTKIRPRTRKKRFANLANRPLYFAFFVGTTGFEPATPPVSQAFLRGTERFFSRENRYHGVPGRPRRYAEVVCKVVCILARRPSVRPGEVAARCRLLPRTLSRSPS
jgi:hypothetical protein